LQVRVQVPNTTCLIIFAFYRCYENTEPVTISDNPSKSGPISIIFVTHNPLTYTYCSANCDKIALLVSLHLKLTAAYLHVQLFEKVTKGKYYYTRDEYNIIHKIIS